MWHQAVTAHVTSSAWAPAGSQGFLKHQGQTPEFPSGTHGGLGSNHAANKQVWSCRRCQAESGDGCRQSQSRCKGPGVTTCWWQQPHLGRSKPGPGTGGLHRLHPGDPAWTGCAVTGAGWAGTSPSLPPPVRSGQNVLGQRQWQAMAMLLAGASSSRFLNRSPDWHPSRQLGENKWGCPPPLAWHPATARDR